MIDFVFDVISLKTDMFVYIVFFCQAEDGIRDLVRSRGLGDVYKRQPAGRGRALAGAVPGQHAGAHEPADRRLPHD